MKIFLLKTKGIFLPSLFAIGMILFSMNVYSQAPANNTCATAEELISRKNGCTNTAGTLLRATASLATGCGNINSPDVYYSFVAQYNEPLITLSSIGATLQTRNPRIQLLDGCSGTSISCGSWVSGTTMSLQTSGLTIGKTYIIRITTNTSFSSPTSGTYGFNICINDKIQIDYSKSYVNITDGTTGGTNNPGDILEVRATFVVTGLTTEQVSKVSFYDTLQLNNGLNFKDSLASRTNEGKLYQFFTTAADSDAGSVTTISGSDTAIRINLGASATSSVGGNLFSNSLPKFYSNTCIIVATYRVKINAAYGTKINIGGGAFRYSIGTNNYVVNFPADQLIVYETLTACSDAVSPGNLIGSASNGTFGTLPLGSSAAGTQNAGPEAINTTYDYQNIGSNAPQDYYYSRTNNLSPSLSLDQTLPKASAGNRVFGVWDITGDHTGATDLQRGNSPCNESLPVSASNPCGYFLAINAAYRSDIVFEYNVTGACSETYYEVSAWFKNLCYKCGCDVNGIASSGAGYIPTAPGDSSGVRPNIAMKIDGIHYYTTGDIAYQGLGGTQTGSDTLNNWVRRSFVFKTLAGQSNFKITFANNAPGGGGNDWAIDDIELRTCYPDMIYAPPNPIAYVGSSLTLSDTIRSYFDNYRNYKWQRRPVATGIWVDIAGASGVGNPVLVGSNYDYVVSYTIPGSATQPSNAGDLYRVVVASNLANLVGGCNYSPDVSFSLYPVDAPCTFTATNSAVVPENTTIDWNKLNWSLGHIPTCCESALITYASNKSGGAPGNVVITNDICIINLTLVNSSPGNLQLFKTVLQPTFNMYMRGNVRMQASSTFSADTCIFIAKGTNTINIDGNTEIGKSTDNNAYSVFGSEPGTTSYVNYIMRGDSLTINKRGLINDRFTSIQLDPYSGSAKLVNNTNTSPFANAVTFDRLIIGNSNARTVALAGSNANSFLNTNGGYIDVTTNSTLIMPANLTLNARSPYNSQVFLRAGANLNLGGSTGGIPGSNFPRFFNTYTLTPTSTVLFDGTVAQSMPGVSDNINPYGNITLAGTGLKTASSGNTILAGNFYRKNGGHTFSANKGRFTFTSTTALQRYYADAGATATNFYDLTNNNSFTSGLRIDSTIGVINELELTTNSKITLNTGDIIMRSADSITSHIKNLGATIPSITYNTSYRFQIERYLFGVKAWRFLATPVLDSIADATSPTTGASWRENYASLTANGYGTAITGPVSSPSFGAAAPLDYQTAFPSMKYYSSAVNNFIGISDARNYKLANAAGYMLFVRGDRGAANVLDPWVLGTKTTLRMKGKIRTANQSFTVLGNSVQSIGNPYASQINFSTVTKAVGIVDAFTIWDPTLAGNFGVGGYQNYVKVGVNYRLNGLAGGTIRNSLESGEAFFVQTNTPGSKILTITESDKGLLSNLVSREGAESISIPTIDIELYQKDATGEMLLIDGVSTSFHDKFSVALDDDDAVKFINNYNNLFIPKSGKRLVVEKRPAINVTDTVNLGFSGLSVMAHQFKVSPFMLSSTGLDAYLLDRFKNKEIELSLSNPTDVDFEITSDPASRAQYRFSIIFKRSENNFTSITATRNADKTVTVGWGMENEKSAKGYIVEQSNDGTNFLPISSNAAKDNNGGNPTYVYLHADASKAANWYRVKAEFIGKADKYTAVASVIAVPSEATDTNSSITISPNPIVDNSINLLFKNMVLGNYNIKISSASGQIMHKGIINIQASNCVKNIRPNKLATGVYQVLLTDKNGKQRVLSLVVQ